MVSNCSHLPPNVKVLVRPTRHSTEDAAEGENYPTEEESAPTNSKQFGKVEEEEVAESRSEQQPFVERFTSFHALAKEVRATRTEIENAILVSIQYFAVLFSVFFRMVTQLLLDNALRNWLHSVFRDGLLMEKQLKKEQMSQIENLVNTED